MKQHTLNQLEKSFKDIMINEHNNSDGYMIIVPTTNDWEYDLPSEIQKTDLMRLDIKDWSREQSHLDDSGLYLTTAFGEDENSKFFPFNEIVSIYTIEGEELFTKKYYKLEQPVPEPAIKTNHTLKSIMHPDTKELKHSKSKLSLVTPKKKTK